ncbi:molybdopterin-binding protein [Faecalibacterium prausnitzii]|uniref:molybdopterin-binding protein n=1 Tax=Faecalibacterium prausnitzii TaxID=853 RepID=UPI003C2F3CFC
MGKILAICTSPKRGTVKTEVPEATLTPEWGIETDAHGGSWHRQVSLLSAEKIENFRKKIWVDYGAFGENLVVEGFDFRNLPVTSRFQVGEVVLEMTQIGKECHSDCAIRRQTGDCIMPREGVFARVLHGGTLHVGDEMILLPPEEDPPLRAAVITLSDKGARGEREDKSGPLIVEMLTAAGYKVEETMILPDETKALKAQLIRLADGRQVNLILTTGGTGFSPRDITPEATYAVATRSAPGIAEAMRYHSLTITPRGMLSRAASVLRGKTLIVNLPGSPKAVKENLEYILPSLAHGIRLAAGLDGECARK